MLNYDIYSNINDQDSIAVEKRLIIIEEKMKRHLFLLGWKCTCPISKNDVLIIDFITDEKLFMGNMGIRYDDKSEGQFFSFYVTKSYDGGE